MIVPLVLIANNWDDHDRSEKYTALAMAKHYLGSCQKNAILFSIGDNDTFALWYAQEIEGYRTDVRVVNTSLFQTDWYIDQMKRKTYKAEAIPSQLTHDEYKYGTLDVAYYFPEIFPQLKDSVLELDNFMKWIRSDSKRTFYDLDEDGNPEKILPTNKIRIPVNKENVLKYGIVAQKDADKIVPYIDITIDRALGKNTILMLDILNNFDWKRPIYFTGGSNTNSEYIWLKEYLQLDGVAFKLVPIKTPTKIYDKNGELQRELSLFDLGRIDTEKMYNNVKKWDWRNINDGEIYLDEQTKRNAISLRNSLMRLSTAFAMEGDTLKAVEVLDLSLDKLAIEDFDHYSLSMEYPEMYYQLGEQEKARATAEDLIRLFKEKLVWFSTFPADEFDIVFEEFDMTFRYLYRGIVDQVRQYDTDETFVRELETEFNETLNLFQHIIPQEEEIDPTELDLLKK
jgi:hypothetical protein